MHKNTTQRTRRPKGRKPRTEWKQRNTTSGTLSLPRVMPDELDVKLQYRDMRVLLNAGSGIMFKEFQANGTYDVDPALGSTEVYGFDEYAALYSYYRVIGYDYNVTAINLESTFAVNTYILNTNVQPSGTGSAYLLMSSLPYNKSKLLAPAGSQGCTHSFRGHIEISKLLGSRAVETDDNFRALTTAVPADLIWHSIVVEANGPNLLGNGVSIDLKLTMHIRFYARELDLSLASMEAKLAAKLKRVQEYKAARQKLEFEKKQKCLTHQATLPALKQ